MDNHVLQAEERALVEARRPTSMSPAPLFLCPKTDAWAGSDSCWGYESALRLSMSSGLHIRFPQLQEQEFKGTKNTKLRILPHPHHANDPLDEGIRRRLVGMKERRGC
jgi:hypothetical protein